MRFPINKPTVLIVLSLVLLGGCMSRPSGPTHLDGGVQTSSLKPLTFTVERATYYPLFFSDQEGGPVIPAPLARQWKTNYVVFSRGLVAAAKKEKLHSESLRKILEIIRGPENPGLALLPVAAHETILNGELVWVVSVRWEIAKWVEIDAGMGHLRVYTFSQRTFKLVDFSTCG